MEILRTLERHYEDMQDTEFTIEEGRPVHAPDAHAKRPAQAASASPSTRSRRACSRRPRRSRRSTPARWTRCCTPPSTRRRLRGRGPRRAASPGAAKGAIVFTAEEAVAAAEDGRGVILVRPFTEADDVAGFHAAKGILTSEGGKASHARSWRARGQPGGHRRGRRPHRPARQARSTSAAGLRAGDLIAIDGRRARHARRRPARHAELDERFETVLAGATSCARSACAPTPTRRRTPARPRVRRRGHRAVPDRAHVHGRRPPAEDAADDHGRGRRPARGAGRAAPAPAGLRGLFEAMDGLPVTIRLLDPPLHEFLPDRFELVERITEARLIERARAGGARAHARAHPALEEGNPMLGTRGVRLGLLTRDLRDAGARHLPRAARRARAHGPRPRGRDHDPARRLRPRARAGAALVVRVGAEEGFEPGRDFGLGTMIELPRACFVAGEIARTPSSSRSAPTT